MKRILLAAVAASATLSLPAHAHHPLGGATPASFADGLLSGLAHPVIGFDHLAFIVLVGLAAARVGRSFPTALGFVAAFVAATAGGTLLHVGGGASGIVLPFGEAVVVVSIVILGAVLASGRRALASPLLVAGFAVAGLFHGWAYGAAVVGAEATPIVAYLAGLALVQGAIAAGVAVAARRTISAVAGLDPARVPAGPRIAAAVCLGVGLTFALEGMESALFGAV